MPMRAGQLRHRVELQSVSEARDSYGAAVLTYTTADTVYSSIEPLDGSESWDAKQIEAGNTHVVTVRGTATVTPRYRVKFGSRYFDIASVVNIDERGFVKRLICKETT